MSTPAPATPAVVLLVLYLLGAAGCAGRRSSEPMTGAHFSMLTYNVNFGGPRPDLAVEAIAEADADVVCLQETNPAWERMVRDALASATRT
jgi:endonuclease/exonuclease/phosphatase (EEP) superfamily protein YafD